MALGKILAMNGAGQLVMVDSGEIAHAVEGDVPPQPPEFNAGNYYWMELATTGVSCASPATAYNYSPILGSNFGSFGACVSEKLYEWHHGDYATLAAAKADGLTWSTWPLTAYTWTGTRYYIHQYVQSEVSSNLVEFIDMYIESADGGFTNSTIPYYWRGSNRLIVYDGVESYATEAEAETALRAWFAAADRFEIP